MTSAHVKTPTRCHAQGMRTLVQHLARRQKSAGCLNVYATCKTARNTITEKVLYHEIK